MHELFGDSKGNWSKSIFASFSIFVFDQPVLVSLSLSLSFSLTHRRTCLIWCYVFKHLLFLNQLHLIISFFYTEILLSLLSFFQSFLLSYFLSLCHSFILSFFLSLCHSVRFSFLLFHSFFIVSLFLFSFLSATLSFF